MEGGATHAGMRGPRLWLPGQGQPQAWAGEGEAMVLPTPLRSSGGSVALGAPGHSVSAVARFIWSRDFVKLAELRYCDHSSSHIISESLCHTSLSCRFGAREGGALSGSGQVEVGAVEASTGVSGSMFLSVPLTFLLIKVNARHPGAENHFRERPLQSTKRSGLCELLERD